MHISLDSALGRQRRLNSVGESITQIAPDPAAAYSLRSLTGGDPKVVRVRRGSDNHEQDFTASDVSSGALQDFVNAQVVAPLDIQALSATGRDGDFLIAKAAYSLRSLGTRQATVAATGDTVARANGKYVCQVRRNVNGDLKSFTATEVTDGTLLSFVNESFTSSLPLDVQGSAAAAYSLRNLSSSYSGNVVEVRRSSDDTTQNFTATEITDGTLLSFVGTGGSDNGFVKTWYDQSGNSNNAVQATASEQPKIVSAGSFLNELDFDGTDDNFELTSVLGITSAAAIFTVAESGGGNDKLILDNRDSSVDGFRLLRLSDDLEYRWQSATVDTGTNLGTNTKFLGFANHDGSNASAAVNGATATTTSDTSSISVAATPRIGARSFSSASSFWDGTMNELIIYASDQSDKRRAIEESIATNYGITLGSFNRDGFVKTWYDQSVTTQAGDTATGNHATQATAANQPKIVSAGSLLNELDFDGTEDMALATGSFSLTQAYTTFSVSHTDDASTSQGVWSTAPSISNQFNAVSFFRNDDGLAVNSGSTLTTAGTIDYVADRTYLQTNVVNGGSSSVFVDGVTGVTGDAGSNNPSGILILGFYRVSSANQNLDGGIKELIIYDSDQSDNRTAIEANIGEVYSIDLPSGVDPGFDQVDGFVETWYDQSGNGNDAVQATASLQPKIVDAGSLLADGVTFDGTDDVLTSINSSLTNYTFAGVYTVKTIADNTGFLGKGAGASDREFFVRMKSDGKVEHRVYSTGSSSTFDTIASSASAISADTTSLIAGSFNGSTNAIRLDIDDTVLTATSSVGLYAATSSLTIPSALGNEAHTAVAELLFYNTDESGKLSDIKTNINSHYSIF